MPVKTPRTGLVAIMDLPKYARRYDLPPVVEAVVTTAVVLRDSVQERAQHDGVTANFGSASAIEVLCALARWFEALPPAHRAAVERALAEPAGGAP